MKLPCVYIITNKSHREFSVGASEDLARDIFRLKKKAKEKLTIEEALTKLVWYQTGSSLKSVTSDAERISSEPLETKLMLIRKLNPQWRDLYQKIT